MPHKFVSVPIRISTESEESAYIYKSGEI